MDARNGDRGHKFLAVLRWGCHSADHRDHSDWNEQTTLCSVTLKGRDPRVVTPLSENCSDTPAALYSGI
jgi:hypothetical protein